MVVKKDDCREMLEEAIQKSVVMDAPDQPLVLIVEVPLRFAVMITELQGRWDEVYRLLVERATQSFCEAIRVKFLAVKNGEG